MRRKRWLLRSTKNALVWLGVVAITAFVFLPILWGIRTSIAPRYDPGIIPARLTLENYTRLLGQPEIYRYVGNSIVVSGLAVVIVLPVAILAAYALSRFRFRGERLGILFLVLPMLPTVALLVPLIRYMNGLGLYNRLSAVVLVNAIFSMPFAVWMLRNFIIANPASIEEAALIDGCSRMRMLLLIAVPMMAPGMVAVGLFVFISSWSNYLYSFALTTSPGSQVLPKAILSFMGAWGIDWGGLTAIGLLSMVPPVVLFLVFQRWFVAGLFGNQLK